MRRKPNWEAGDAAAESGRNVVTSYWLYAFYRSRIIDELAIPQSYQATYRYGTDITQKPNWQIGDAAAESGRWLTDFIQKPNWQIGDAAA